MMIFPSYVIAFNGTSSCARQDMISTRYNNQSTQFARKLRKLFTSYLLNQHNQLLL